MCIYKRLHDKRYLRYYGVTYMPFGLDIVACYDFGSPGSLLDPKVIQWRHSGRYGVSNHQPYGCLLNRLFRRRSKKTSKLRVTGFCVGNSKVTGEFPIQMASNAENVPFDDVIILILNEMTIIWGYLSEFKLALLSCLCAIFRLSLGTIILFRLAHTCRSVRRRAINWINDDLLSNGPSEHFCWNMSRHMIIFNKIELKMSSATYRPFCWGLALYPVASSSYVSPS